jgi:hypothetical protein
MLKHIILSLLIVAAVPGCSKKGGKSAEATLEDLNRALQEYVAANSTYPGSVSELTNLPALQGKPLPTLEPGQMLVIDKQIGRVVLVGE